MGDRRTLLASPLGRVLVLAVAIALGVTACSSGNKQATGSTTAASGGSPSSTAPGSSSGGSVPSLASTLAASGIATVADESSGKPLVAVSGSVVMRFTQAQVDSMAAGLADHGGVLGSSLDAAVPPAAGDPPLSYLLAAWVSQGPSAGAAAMRAAMGQQDWSSAPSLSFPMAALPLFTADVVHAFATPSGSNAGTSTTAGAIGDPGAAAQARPAVLTGLVSAPCSLVSNFMNDVLDSVFHALSLTAPSGSSVVARVGSFFVNLWNIALSYARQVVSGLVSTVGSLVVGKIASAAAAAATVAEIVSNISPWTITVRADPTSVSLGGSSGSFVATASAGGGVDYPAAVTNCATAVGISLPSLSTKGASASWAVDGPVSPTSDTSVKLDAKGSNTLTYKTGPAPCTTSSPSAPQTAKGTITITRPAIDKLKSLVDTLTSGIPGIAGPIAKTVLAPLVSSILSKLDGLTQLVGSASVTLTPSPPGGSSQTSCTCAVGSWRVVNQVVSLDHVSGGAGATWVIQADGRADIDYAGAAPLVGSLVTIQYAGSEVEQIELPTDLEASSGTWKVTSISGNIIATTTVLGQTTTKPVPRDPGATEEGQWSCSGNSMTTSYAGVGETVTLTRISH